MREYVADDFPGLFLGGRIEQFTRVGYAQQPIGCVNGVALRGRGRTERRQRSSAGPLRRRIWRLSAASAVSGQNTGYQVYCIGPGGKSFSAADDIGSTRTSGRFDRPNRGKIPILNIYSQKLINIELGASMTICRFQAGVVNIVQAGTMVRHGYCKIKLLTDQAAETALFGNRTYRSPIDQ